MVVLGSDGSVLHKFAGPEPEVRGPSRFAITPQNQLVFIGASQHTLLLYTMGGRLLAEFGSEHQMVATDVTVDRHGTIYVCNGAHCEIAVFSGDGRYQRSIALPTCPAVSTRRLTANQC